MQRNQDLAFRAVGTPAGDELASALDLLKNPVSEEMGRKW